MGKWGYGEMGNGGEWGGMGDGGNGEMICKWRLTKSHSGQVEGQETPV